MVTCKWTISMAPIMTWFILYILLSFPGTTTARAAEGGQRKGNAQADEAGRGTKPHEHSHGVDGEEFGFDHDAFLGPEEAKRFDELTTEESKTRLGRIVDKIDGDGDGQVTKAELSTWISRTRRRHTTNEARKRFKDYDQKGKGGITWSDYLQSTQALDVNSPDSTPSPTSVIGRRLAREGRRFKAADSDGDGIITAAEFTAFIYPDDFLHMGEITLEETIEDLDKNKDGFVEEEEYISDLRGSSGLDLAAEKREREIFREDRDVDRDGKLSLEELRQWVLPPPNYDFALAETNHLIRETDQDKDGKLTKPEILQSWNVFVGSQATNYGHDLTAKHDEL